MPKNHKPVDWSEGHFKQMLVQHRKFMWRQDTIEMFPKWLGLKQGMTAVDVGCGLGFLGYTLWPFIGEGGSYTGVDISAKLLDDARKAAEDWSKGGTARFLEADAGALPLEDNSVDLAMCQMLLMHLTDPEKALSEMVRVTKPGGTLLCIETDWISSKLRKAYWSVPDLPIEEQLLSFKIDMYVAQGRIKLGRGDCNVAVRIVHMMSQLGLTGIDPRLADDVWFLEPPYDGEEQQHRLERFKKDYLDDKYRKTLADKDKEEFLAGGGDEADFDRYLAITGRFVGQVREQIEAGEFAVCGSSDVYMVKGVKPVG